MNRIIILTVFLFEFSSITFSQVDKNPNGLSLSKLNFIRIVADDLGFAILV